jgi:hypothetical protein
MRTEIDPVHGPDPASDALASLDDDDVHVLFAERAGRRETRHPRSDDDDARGSS